MWQHWITVKTIRADHLSSFLSLADILLDPVENKCLVAEEFFLSEIWATLNLHCIYFEQEHPSAAAAGKNGCPISLPVVVLRVSLDSVSSSKWWERNHQLSQSGCLKIGTIVWLFCPYSDHSSIGNMKKASVLCCMHWRQCKKRTAWKQTSVC